MSNLPASLEAAGLEDVLIAAKAILVEHLPTALNTVEARYAATDPLTLADVASHQYRYAAAEDIGVVEPPWPVVILRGFRQTPGTEGEQDWDYYDYVVGVDLVLEDDDDQILSKRLFRYGLALLHVLRAHRTLDGTAVDCTTPEIIHELVGVVEGPLMGVVGLRLTARRPL